MQIHHYALLAVLPASACAVTNEDPLRCEEAPVHLFSAFVEDSDADRFKFTACSQSITAEPVPNGYELTIQGSEDFIPDGDPSEDPLRTIRLTARFPGAESVPDDLSGVFSFFSAFGEGRAAFAHEGLPERQAEDGGLEIEDADGVLTGSFFFVVIEDGVPLHRVDNGEFALPKSMIE